MALSESAVSELGVFLDSLEDSPHRTMFRLWIEKALVDGGAPPGIRTQNLRIKSPLLCR
jgi:hypothetical protein